MLTKGIVWEPSNEIIDNSNIKRFMDKYGIETYEELTKRSSEDIEWFWDAAVKDLGIEWFKPYNKILDVSAGIPWAKWFIGGKLNIVHNCIDRHATSEKAESIACTWEGDDGSIRRLSYREMYEEINRLANGLKFLDIGKGDTVGIYMPMLPEVLLALYACLKIGAIAIPIFSGYGTKAVATRLDDAEAKVLFTADGGLRRGKNVEIKREADSAVEGVDSVKNVIVYKRLGIGIPWNEDRDIWWDDFVGNQSRECETEEMESEDISIMIYTSGTTGKPKGTVHTHAGCLAQMAKEVHYYFDIRPDDVLFWVTDIGWMMGPWMIIGGQCFGTEIMIYEGTINHPEPDRLWDLIEKHKVSVLGISPTAIRMLMRYDHDWIEKHDLGSLRILGSTGEPWDEDSWMWFLRNVGGSRCPIINISGGTEIVGCFLAPLPINSLKPCTLRGPGLGMAIDVYDEEGKPVRGEIGYLVATKPAPSMTKGLWKDPKRYIETYWSKWPDVWYHGDWASIDEDGFWFLHGRADDTIKVAGKRVGPAEIEGALILHPKVSEAAAIGAPHEIKGEVIVCFVVLKPGVEPNEELRNGLKEHVVGILGKTMKPEDVKFVKELPKTRSAKILRRMIKARFLGKNDLGDISSVDNPHALEEIGKAV
jgi:acetyl-CoA synthetase